MPFVMGAPQMAALITLLGPTPAAGLPLPPPLAVDDWNGYNAERQTIMQTVRNAGIANVVVLTGDYHESFATDLPTAIDTYSFDRNSIGVEFVVPAVTSPGTGETVQGFFGTEGIGAAVDAVFEANLAAHNPWIRYHDGVANGFGVVEVTAERTHYDFLFLANRMDPATAVSVAASWQARGGDPHVEPASGPLGPRVRQANQEAAPALATAPPAAGPAPAAAPLPATGAEDMLAPAAAAVTGGLVLRRLLQEQPLPES
jgi:alkaline phosphatase D